jgi:DNA-binding transcriptional regulator YhcF (GntR family)
MSIKAMSWVWDQSPDKSTRLLLLLAIADHCNDEGECYPSIKRLAAKCRMSVRRTQQVIESLKREGVLGMVIGGGLGTNGGKTNIMQSRDKWESVSNKVYSIGLK